MLSPVELFQKVSPSVFVVQSLDDNGKTLMLGSGVALAPDFLITNCHVVQSSSRCRSAEVRKTGPQNSLRPRRITIFVDSGPAD
jgi:hypothetical protein